MGFLQDLGSFISDVNAIGDEIDGVKKDVVDSLIDSATQVKTTLSDASADIATMAEEVGSTVKQSASLPQTVSDGTGQDEYVFVYWYDDRHLFSFPVAQQRQY